MSLNLQFLNDLIRLGYRGKDDALVKARDAGEKYLRDVLAAGVEPQSHLRPSVLGLGQSRLHLRGAQLHGPVHDGPPRGLPAVENATSAISCRCSSAARASIRVPPAASTRARGRFPRRATAAASRCNIRRCTWRPRGPATRRWPTTPGPGRSPAGRASSPPTTPTRPAWWKTASTAASW